MPFQDIRGQDRPIQRLKKYLSRQRMAGAYLFTGPEGVGKKLAALTLAKALNCLTRQDDSCDTCASCLKINKHQHPDVKIINNSGPEPDESHSHSEIKIEFIRAMQDEINLRPYEGRKKVFIVDGAHHLNPEASNAFLKTLEEPPENSIIILISEKPAFIFKTIISRCQVIKFFPFKKKELNTILKDEYHLDDNLSHYLSNFSEGRLGEALRLKDTDIMLKKNKIINGFIVPAPQGGFSSVIAPTRDIVREELNILASWFRDLYLVKAGLKFEDLINFDRKEEIARLVDGYSFTDLEQVLNVIAKSLNLLDRNVNVKLLLSNLRASLKN